jgi:Beta-ketoacyl synthase, N-terminal domain
MSQDLQDDLTPSEGAEGIAVVGMAGRFPGAADLDEFWRNLRAGVESPLRCMHVLSQGCR